MQENPYSTSMVGPAPDGPPAADQLAGHAARGGHHVVGRLAEIVDRADDLGVGRRSRAAGSRSASMWASHSPRTVRRPGGPSAGGRASPPARPRSSSAAAASRDHRERAVLDRVEAGGVELTSRTSGREYRPRRGREVLQPSSHREHQVRLGRKGIGRGRAGDAERPGVQRVVVRDEGAPGGGLGRPGCRAARRIPGACGPAPGVPHAAAEHQQRACATRATTAAARRRRGSVGPRARRRACTTGSNSASGKSKASACTSCGSARVTGPAVGRDRSAPARPAAASRAAARGG